MQTTDMAYLRKDSGGRGNRVRESLGSQELESLFNQENRPNQRFQKPQDADPEAGGLRNVINRRANLPHAIYRCARTLISTMFRHRSTSLARLNIFKRHCLQYIMGLPCCKWSADRTSGFPAQAGDAW